MRISDWSSDVCSSDLQREPRREGPADLPEQADAASVDPGGRSFADRVVQIVEAAYPVDSVILEKESGDPAKVSVVRRQNLQFLREAVLIDVEKIGRASCRERVCQYV